MDALAYLFSLETLGIKFGLENIRTICEALGHPERAWPSAVVAGTNGKGSVAAMVETGLRAAGLRTGLYTSPHLVRLEERFAIDGAPVATDDMAAAAATVRDAVAALRAAGRLAAEPTFFEVTTALGFELFRRARVDFVVLEVGLGGRFDATTAATPVAAAITTIDFDHERFLGHTIAAIAAEKAGVIKPGMRGRRRGDEAGRGGGDRAGVRRAARDDDSGRGGRPFDVVAVEEGAAVVRLRTPRRDYGTVRLALRGRHQVQNAVVAVRLLEALDDLGFTVPPAAIAAAVTVHALARTTRPAGWRARPHGAVRRGAQPGWRAVPGRLPARGLPGRASARLRHHEGQGRRRHSGPAASVGHPPGGDGGAHRPGDGGRSTA